MLLANDFPILDPGLSPCSQKNIAGLLTFFFRGTSSGTIVIARTVAVEGPKYFQLLMYGGAHGVFVSLLTVSGHYWKPVVSTWDRTPQFRPRSSYCKLSSIQPFLAFRYQSPTVSQIFPRLPAWIRSRDFTRYRGGKSGSLRDDNKI